MQVRNLEAAVKEKLEDQVLDKLSMAIESQDRKTLNEAVGLAQRVHEFEAKSRKLQQAEQVMQMRPQGIWNTTHINTRVGGGNLAFDPLGIDIDDDMFRAKQNEVMTDLELQQHSIEETPLATGGFAAIHRARFVNATCAVIFDSAR